MLARGSKGSSTPSRAAVAGVSCISPRAPRLETARVLNCDSVSMIAATRFCEKPYKVAASLMWASRPTGSAATCWNSFGAAMRDAMYPESIVSTSTEKPSRCRLMDERGSAI